MLTRARSGRSSPALLSASAARHGDAHDGQALPLEENACSLEERPVVVHNEDPGRHGTSVADGTPRALLLARPLIMQVIEARLHIKHDRTLE